jgi:hypothetical protein
MVKRGWMVLVMNAGKVREMAHSGKSEFTSG